MNKSEMNFSAGEKLMACIRKHKRFGIILMGILVLNLVFGFDARFTLINFLWILIGIVKIN